MDGPPAGLSCGGQSTSSEGETSTCVKSVCIREPEPPVESSCRPTSNANLSVSDRDVVKQLRYCSREGSEVTSRSDRPLGVVHVECAHHAGVGVSQEDGVSVQQRSVTPTLGGLVKNF